jgi:hypothetical protein
MSRKSNRVARFSGLAIAGLGLAHFTSPRMWGADHQDRIPAQHPSALLHQRRYRNYTKGGIETVLGLSFSSRQTRSLATVGLIGYLAYLGGNAIRHAQTP